MSPFATTISLALILLVGIAIHGRLRGAASGLLELHFIAVALYFSVYTIIDISFNTLVISDTLIIIVTFGLIIFSILLSGFIAYLFQRRLERASSMATMSIRWIDANQSTVVVVTLIIVGFNVYLFTAYGITGNFSDIELQLLGLTIPSWVGSTRKLLEGLGFGVFIFAWSRIVFNKQSSRRLNFLLLLLMITLIAMGGRRSLMSLAVFAAFLWSIKNYKQFYSLRNFKIVFILGFCAVVFSNIYQTYRSNVLSVGGGAAGASLPSLYEATTNFEATADNFKVRTAMWQYNYSIVEKQVAKEIPPMLGSLFIYSFENSIPRALSLNKNIVDLDGIVASHYDLPLVDYPTNNYASLQADFGLVMVIFSPLFIFLPIFVLMLIGKKSQDLYLFASGLTISYIMNVENSPGDIFILFRDIGLVWFGLIGSRLILLMIYRFLHQIVASKNRPILE
jgi:hypothetical protein